MGFHQYFLCKSRYQRLLSPNAALARCGKHFRFEAPKVNHLINTAIPTMSFFSLCGKPVVVKHLTQMTLKSFPVHSELTQLPGWCVGTGGAAAIFKSSSREWRSKPGAMSQPSRELLWDSPTTVSRKFQALFSPSIVHLLPRVLQRDPDHVKYSQSEQRASFCVLKTTSSVMTDNCSLVTKSITGIGNPPGWYLALKS